MIKELTDMRKNRHLKVQKYENQILSTLILFLALLLGIIVRWNFIAHSEFPVNDGGFFYQMILDLAENDYALPKYTSYNHANIPFAYPPLSFYLSGGLFELTGISILKLLFYLPLFFSVLTIPAFYLFTNTFFEGRFFYRSLATFLFATLPRSFEWLVMGGGITRSLGFLFALLALVFASKAFKEEGGWLSVILAAILAGLTILSHPVASLFLGFSLVVFYIYYWPSRVAKLVVIGLIAVMVASPWWINILSVHGINPFVGATNTGHVNWFQIKYLLTLNFEYENRFFLPVLSFLALIGLFNISRREALFLGFLIGPGYLIIPRGGIDLLTGYVALLGTFGFDLIASVFLDKSNTHNDHIQNLIKSRESKIMLFFIVIYTFLAAYTYKYMDGKVDLHLNEENYKAMRWLRDHSEHGAKVIVMPSNDSHRNWPNDYLSEWLPAISGRESLATVQGYEWLPDLFSKRIIDYIELRNCASVGVECIESWQTQKELLADYIYIGDRDQDVLLEKDLVNSSAYEVVYGTDEVVIFMLAPH